MFVLPYYLLFWFLLVLSTFVVFCSVSWFSMWLGLEMNMLCFVVCLMSEVNMRESEAGVKYFLAQVLGSVGFLSGSLGMNYYGVGFGLYWFIWVYLVMLSMFLKLGVAPLHFWFPGVMDGISMLNCGILMTWQKLGPFCILMELHGSLSMIMYTFFGVVSGLVGGFGGLNQVSLRKLLAYSSIGHLGWLLGALCVSDYVWRIYFFIYSLITLSVVWFLFEVSVSFLGQVALLGGKSGAVVVLFVVLFFSLGGLPPFGGFFMKWLVFSGLVGEGLVVFGIFLILGSLLNLYYYLRVCYGLYLVSVEAQSWNVSGLYGGANLGLVGLALVAVLSVFVGSYFNFLLG